MHSARRTDVRVAARNVETGAGDAHQVPRTDEVARLERAFTVLGRAFLNLSSSRSDMELDRTSYFGLVLLHENGPARVSDLAAALGLDVSTVSRMLSQLTEAGYVEKARDAADKRAHLIALSSRGRDVLNLACAAKRELLGEATSEWSERDRKSLAASMTRLADSLLDISKRVTAVATDPSVTKAPAPTAATDQAVTRVPAATAATDQAVTRVPAATAATDQEGPHPR